MNRKHIILILLLSLPVLAFAVSGETPDATFKALIDELKGYLGGSLGMVFVLIGFIGAAAAVAGFAPMKVMFPVFGLTLALKYGPGILDKMFNSGVTGDVPSVRLYNIQSFSPVDLLIVLAAAAIFVIGANKHQLSGTEKSTHE